LIEKNDVLAPMEAPQDVRVSFVDYESVLLEWMGVYTTIREEPLEGYIVCIHVPLCLLHVNFCNLCSKHLVLEILSVFLKTFYLLCCKSLKLNSFFKNFIWEINCSTYKYDV